MSGLYRFEVPGTLPHLNDYVRAERANRYAAAALKKRAQRQVIEAMQGPPAIKGPVVVLFEWYRPDRRADKDNVAFAKKFVLDALQEAGVIESDKWSMCDPYDKAFAVDRGNPRTVVTICSPPF